jgi:hypothetical protein
MEADTLNGWLEAFSALHRRAKEGALTADERAEYLKDRDELADALLLAQQMSSQPGQGQRRSMRVAQAMPVEIETSQGRMLAVTLDVSSGGFSTIVSEAPEVGTKVTFRLKLGRAAEPIVGAGKVVNAQAANGSVRLGVAFVELGASDRERLDFLIVDAVLKQYGH